MNIYKNMGKYMKNFKYKDLIEKLIPVSDEEVSIVASVTEECYDDFYDEDNGENKYVIARVDFFHSKEDNTDFIVGIEETYDKITCETIDKKIILP